MTLLRWLDRIALFGMAVGMCLMLQPWMKGCFRWGFFMTLSCTVLQIVTAHAASPKGKA
jgi:hypothetical protein